MEQHIEKLNEIEKFGGQRQTEGLPRPVIEHFLQKDPSLARAIDQAAEMHRNLAIENDDLLRLPEVELCDRVQADYVNFYPDHAINPYVALGAAGPWVVTTHGAVLHDSGGYGMLGLGHAPADAIRTLGRPWVMANVMTPSLSHKRFTDRLQREIGRNRNAGCPFERFLCLNSGSEAVSMAARIADINARQQTDPGGPSAGKKIKQLALEEGFHGRTYRPARVSHSTLPIYEQHLASFRSREYLEIVPPNDLEALRAAFERAEAEEVFFDAFFIEPVMGEGQPGLALTREFYDLARELTRKTGTVLVVDSIQAALRAHGCLSIVDYPGFEDCDPPDLETYSKALNAGQFPLSVLALTGPMAELYVKGVYGNTMTTNPRAVEVGSAVLDSLTDALRKNIRERGAELKARFEALAERFPEAIVRVLGTGLMVCAELDPERYPVSGQGGMEEYLRTHGIEMIHGGHNGLRFTPHFGITTEEVELIVDTVRRGLEALGANSH